MTIMDRLRAWKASHVHALGVASAAPLAIALDCSSHWYGFWTGATVVATTVGLAVLGALHAHKGN